MTRAKQVKAATQSLRMPVRIVRIELNGDYKGFWVEMRSNPPLRTFTELQQETDFNGLKSKLGPLIIKWNFVDDDGQPMSCGDIEGISVELFGLVISSYLTKVTESAAVPKA